MAKKIFTSSVEQINKDTGEMVEVNKSVTVSTGGGDKFFMTFIESMSSLYKISCLTDVKLLAKMCCLVDYNGYRVLIPKGVRKEVMEELGINTQTMSNSLKRLKEVGLITGDDGCYEINPNIFWKGSTKERDKILKNDGLEISIKFKCEEKLFGKLKPSKEFNT